VIEFDGQNPPQFTVALCPALRKKDEGLTYPDANPAPGDIVIVTVPDPDVHVTVTLATNPAPLKKVSP
jgi:hypothetical protein